MVIEGFNFMQAVNIQDVEIWTWSADEVTGDNKWALWVSHSLIPEVLENSKDLLVATNVPWPTTMVKWTIVPISATEPMRIKGIVI